MTQARLRTMWGAIALGVLMMTAGAPAWADAATTATATEAATMQDPAVAQTDAEDAPTVSDAITVTAQKREESVQDVSSSIVSRQA